MKSSTKKSPTTADINTSKNQNDPLDKFTSAMEFAKLTSIELNLHEWIKKKFGALPNKTNREWIEIFKKEGVISTIPAIFQ